jgi:hypothetical protein
MLWTWQQVVVILEWLHANRNEGCTEYAFEASASNGHIHIVEWLTQNRQAILHESDQDSV